MIEQSYIIIIAAVLMAVVIGQIIHYVRLYKFEGWVISQFKEVAKVSENYSKNFEAIDAFFSQVTERSDDGK